MHGPRRTHDGWRARIGIVMPSSNTAFESWLPKAAPDGVSLHFARMAYSREEDIAAALEKMEQYEEAAVRQLMDCEPDVLLFACTASSITKGVAGDQALIARLQALSGIPCTTITDAIGAAFRQLGVQRICLGSPYPEALDRQEADFFREAGFDVMASHGLGLSDPAEMCDIPPAEIYRFARSIWNGNAQALLLSCGAFRAQYVAAALEADLGVPVVTSITATLWAGLRLAGVMEPVPGFGRLLSMPGRPFPAA